MFCQVSLSAVHNVNTTLCDNVTVVLSYPNEIKFSTEFNRKSPRAKRAQRQRSHVLCPTEPDAAECCKLITDVSSVGPSTVVGADGTYECVDNAGVASFAHRPPQAARMKDGHLGWKTVHLKPDRRHTGRANSIGRVVTARSYELSKVFPMNLALFGAIRFAYFVHRWIGVYCFDISKDKCFL